MIVPGIFFFNSWELCAGIFSGKREKGKRNERKRMEWKEKKYVKNAWKNMNMHRQILPILDSDS